MQLTFLGAVGTVTGSKYLIESGTKRISVDCGLFQGYKQLRMRNWQPLPINPESIDAVILTHAHIDHSGYLPLLVRNGFRGRVVCTVPTRDLCEILLPDSGFLQERDAEYANRHGFSKHHPALPLYTRADAETSLEQFDPMHFHAECDLGDGLNVRFRRSGHILGAALVEVSWKGISVLFSGDLGRPNSPTMLAPEPIGDPDYLIVESTYGDRHHDAGDPETVIADIVTKSAGRGGTILIPAFAVGRAQTLLYHIHRLKLAGRIPDLPVFLDSPMAINASELFCKHLGDHRLSADECRSICAVAQYVRTAEESRSLDENRVPKIIISASGMATGGRILHHLKTFAPDHRNAILFAGFQAGGTRGAAMVAGAQHVKIHGQQVPVRAKVNNLHMLSAHADSDEIIDWLNAAHSVPRMTFITHGEPAASDGLRHRVEEELDWPCRVPDYRDEVVLK